MSDVPCCYCGEKLGWPNLDWDVFNVRHGMCCKPCFNRKAGVMSDDEKIRIAKSAESLVELMEMAAGHKVYFSEPIQSCEEAKIMLQGNQIDDPAVWLVEEFGAESIRLGSYVSRVLVIYSPCDNEDESTWLIAYHTSGIWEVFNQTTAQPLTRADVCRLCELFGVEVKQ